MEEQVNNEEKSSVYGLFTVNATALTSAELVTFETTEVSVADTCDAKNEGNATESIRESMVHHELALPVITEQSECTVKCINGELVVSEDLEHVNDEKNFAQNVLEGSTTTSVRFEDMLETSQCTNISNKQEQMNGTEEVLTTSQNDLNVEKILMNAPMIDLLEVSLDSFVPVAFDIEELQKTLLPCMQESNNAQNTLLYWPTNSTNPEETGSTYVEKIKGVTGNNNEMEVFSQENQQEAFKPDGGIDDVHKKAAILTNESDDVAETSPNNMASDAAQAGNLRELVEETDSYTLRDRDVRRSGKFAGNKRRFSMLDSNASDSDDSSTVSLQLPKLTIQHKPKTQVSRIVSTYFDVENSTRHFTVRHSSTTKMENESKGKLDLKQHSRNTTQTDNHNSILSGISGSVHNTSKASDERPVAAIHHCLFCGTTTEHIQQHWLAKHGHEQAVLAIWLANSESTRSDLIKKLTKFGDEYHELIGVHSVKSIENRNQTSRDALQAKAARMDKCSKHLHDIPVTDGGVTIA